MCMPVCPSGINWFVVNDELSAAGTECAFKCPGEGSRDSFLLAQPCNCKAAEPEMQLQVAVLQILILQIICNEK